MKNIVIFGLGETAHLAYEYFTHDPAYADYTVVGFCADAAFIKADQFLGLPVVAMEEVETIYPPADHMAFAAAGSGHLNRDRETLFHKAKAKGYTLASYVSSRAFVWHNVEIGENCFILEHNTLQPFVRVGDNVVLWSGNHVGHRSVIGDHCFITSHVVISGFCDIGAYSFVGVNAAFAEDVKIAPDNFIAMGCVINKSTVENAVYNGNPAEQKKVAAKRFCGVKEKQDDQSGNTIRTGTA